MYPFLIDPFEEYRFMLVNVTLCSVLFQLKICWYWFLKNQLHTMHTVFPGCMQQWYCVPYLPTGINAFTKWKCIHVLWLLSLCSLDTYPVVLWSCPLMHCLGCAEKRLLEAAFRIPCNKPPFLNANLMWMRLLQSILPDIYQKVRYIV